MRQKGTGGKKGSDSMELYACVCVCVCVCVCL
jgi:hypothetical protein